MGSGHSSSKCLLINGKHGLPDDVILVSPEEALKNPYVCIGVDGSSGTPMAICRKQRRAMPPGMAFGKPPKSGLSTRLEMLVTMITHAMLELMTPASKYTYIQDVFTELYRGYDINTDKQTGNPSNVSLVTWALSEALVRKDKLIDRSQIPKATPYHGGWLHRRYTQRAKGGNETPCCCEPGKCTCCADKKGGAGCCTLGGNKELLEELRGFTTSELQAANTKYVQAVLDAGRKAGLDIKGSTMKEQIQSFLLNCKQISGNSTTCKALGQAINDAAGEQVIDLSLDAAAVCQQVCDMVAGWGGAMTGELLNAYVDLIKVINNNKFTLNVFGEIVGILKKHAMTVDRIETKSGLLNAVAALETGSQLLKQQNAEILGLVARHARPALKNLQELAKKMVGIGDIKSIGKNGTDPISDWVRKVFHLAGMESASAILVQQALKEIGLKSADYIKVLESRQFADLQTLLVSSPVVKSVLSDAENSKVLEALNTLMFYAQHPDKTEAIVVELKKEGGAPDAPSTPYLEGEEMRGVQLEHLVKDFIFKAFARRINDELNIFEQQLDDLSKRVGKADGVPVDPALDDLVDAIDKTNGVFARIRSSNSYLALTGYHNDSNSAQLKRDVLSDLGFFVKIVDQLMANPVYSKAGKFLVGVRDAAKKMIATIDEFSAGVAARQGRSYAQGGQPDDENVAQGGSNTSHRGLMGKVYKSPYETATTLKRFKMNIKIAHVLDNLKRHGADLAGYSEKYDALVARSIAKQLTDARKEQESNMVAMEKAVNDFRATGASDANKKIVNDAYAAWKVFVKEQQQAKENFWATVEAVDLYMKIFTQGLANNPEDVGDIDQMMNNVTLLKDLGSANFAKKMKSWFDSLPGANNDSAYNAAGVKSTPKSTPRNTPVPGNMDPADANLRRVELKENLENFGTLKNLLSVFARICSNFGGADIGTKVFMPPGRIYSNLVNFLSCVAFHNNNQDNASFVSGLAGNAAIQRLAVGLRYGNAPAVGTITVNNAQVQPFYNVFDRELEFFQLVIKSISAKILVVLGLRNIFDRPLNKVPYYKINNLRMIVGGSAPVPQVDDKAVELYLRLPLLCQFYKEIFDYEKPQIITVQPPTPDKTDLPVNDKEHVQISFVPDIDGVFSGLIRFVFRKINFADPAAYSDEDIAEIIRECNSIYAKLAPKHPENTIPCIFDDLVMEVNRRYGLITQERRKQYEAETGFRYDYYRAGPDALYSTSKTEFLPSDYRLLDGEGDETSRMSNAQRLLEAQVTPLENKSREHEAIAVAHRSLIERFRHKIDDLLLKPQSTTFDFKNVIKNTKVRLSTETNNANKFDIICRMLRSSEQFTTGDYIKFMMMHETVVTGLNTLSAIHSILKRFSDMVWLSSPAAFEDAQKLGVSVIEMEPYKGSDFELVWKVIFPNNGTDWASCISPSSRASLFALLVDAIHAVGSDFGDLVKVTFTGKRVHFNFGELKASISQLFQQIGYFIELLRPIMGAREYEEFTGKRVIGSYGWLQNHLWENVVLGRKKEIGQEVGGNKPGRIGLDELSWHLSQTLEKLCADTNISAAILSGVFFVQSDVKDSPTVPVDFTDPIEKLHLVGNPVGGKQQVDLRYVYRCKFSDKPQISAFNFRRSLMFSFNQSIGKYLACFIEHDKIYNGLLDKFFNGAFAEDFKDISSTFADVRPAIISSDKFGRKPVSNNNLFTYTDYLQTGTKNQYKILLPQGTNAGITPPLYRADRADIKYPADGKNILFSSLAHIIENIMLTKNSTLQTTYSYLVENIADVSQAAREKMRANLPIFRDLFKDIRAKCDLFQQLFAHFDMPELSVADYGYQGVYFRTPGICKANFAVKGKDAQNAILASIKKIAAGCDNFIETCSLVIKEIGDAAKASFLETEQGSLKAFHDKNAEYPFCPLSMLTSVFHARSVNSENASLGFMPLFGVGTPEFKMAYGTRSILHSDTGLAQLPYMEQLAQTYNSVCNSGFHVNNKELEGYCGNVLRLIRYIYRFRQITVLSKGTNQEGKLASRDLINIESRGLYAPFVMKPSKYGDYGVADPISSKNTSCSILRMERKGYATLCNAFLAPQTTTANIILMAEDVNVEAQARAVLVASRLIESPKVEKGTMATQNILDLGILPINVHAMSRFVPLAYLYNYGYSFDRLVCELLHGYGYERYLEATLPLSSGLNASLNKAQKITSALDALRLSLIEPFRASAAGDHIYIAEMMRGASTTRGLARGKLLYELYGEVLDGHKPVPRTILGQHESPTGLILRKKVSGGYMGRELTHGGDVDEEVDARLNAVLRTRASDTGHLDLASITGKPDQVVHVVVESANQQDDERFNPHKAYYRRANPTPKETGNGIVLDAFSFFRARYGDNVLFKQNVILPRLSVGNVGPLTLLTIFQTYHKIRDDWINSVKEYFNAQYGQIHAKCFALHLLSISSESDVYTTAIKYANENKIAELVKLIDKRLRKSRLFYPAELETVPSWVDFIAAEQKSPLTTPVKLDNIPTIDNVKTMDEISITATKLLTVYNNMRESIPNLEDLLGESENAGNKDLYKVARWIASNLDQKIKQLQSAQTYEGGPNHIVDNQELIQSVKEGTYMRDQLDGLRKDISGYIAKVRNELESTRQIILMATEVIADMKDKMIVDLDSSIQKVMAANKLLIKDPLHTEQQVKNMLQKVEFDPRAIATTADTAAGKLAKHAQIVADYKVKWDAIDAAWSARSKSVVSGGALDERQQLTLVTMIIRFMVESNHRVAFENVKSFQREFVVKYMDGNTSDVLGDNTLGCVIRYFYHSINPALLNQGLINAMGLPRIAGTSVEQRSGRAGLSAASAAFIETLAKFYANDGVSYFMSDEGKITKDVRVRTPYTLGRYDTSIVRCIVFIQNVYRITHLALRRSQEPDREGEVLVQGPTVTDEDLTEYSPLESSKGSLQHWNDSWGIDKVAENYERP